MSSSPPIVLSIDEQAIRAEAVDTALEHSLSDQRISASAADTGMVAEFVSQAISAEYETGLFFIYKELDDQIVSLSDSMVRAFTTTQTDSFASLEAHALTLTKPVADSSVLADSDTLLVGKVLSESPAFS